MYLSLHFSGYLHSLDVELLAKAFVDCVEEPSTCTQGGTVPIVVSDPSGKKDIHS